MMRNQTSSHAKIVFILCASFCAYEFVLRVKLGPLASQLMSELNLSHHQFALLTAAFFLGYAPMQLFAGPLITRLGARWTLTLALVICSVSTLMFATTNGFYFLFLQRVMAGIGGGFAYVGAYILIAKWFPNRQWAFLYGLLQLIGCLGAMYGQRWIAYITLTMSWRWVFFMLACVGFVLTTFFLLLLQDKSHPFKTSPQPLNLFKQLSFVAQNRQSYAIASYAFLTWGPIAIFATLWGPLFLMNKLSMTVSEASYYVSFTWLGIGLGSPIIGLLSNYITNHRLLMMGCVLLGLLISICLLCHYDFPLPVYAAMLAILGVATAAQPLSFLKIQQANPDSCRGAAVGFNNMAVILSGVLLQPLSGFLITRASIYRNPYEFGLHIMPVCFLLCFLITLFLIKEDVDDASCQKLIA